jgi:endoplasmic reticulum protein 29
MLRWCFCAALLCLCEGRAKGALNLDSWTFDRVVDGSRDVLVKFDKEYAHGESEDHFAALCRALGPLKTTRLLVAEVAVQDYGDKENHDLRVRFGIDVADFPAYRLFKRRAAGAAAAAAAGGTSGAAPLAYTGAVNKDELARWLTVETGLYVGLPGTLESFDALAAGFLALLPLPGGGAAAADGAQAQARARLASAEQELSRLQAGGEGAEGEVRALSARAYVRIMAKAVEQGAAFVGREAKRVRALMGGKITPAKRAFFKERLNILASFTRGEGGGQQPQAEEL